MFECGGPRVYSYEELLKSRRECSPHQADLVSGPSLPGAH